VVLNNIVKKFKLIYRFIICIAILVNILIGGTKVFASSKLANLNELVFYGVNNDGYVIQIDGETFQSKTIFNDSRAEYLYRVEIAPCGRFVLHAGRMKNTGSYQAYIYDSETHENQLLFSEGNGEKTYVELSPQGGFAAHMKLSHVGDNNYTADLVVNSLKDKETTSFKIPLPKITSSRRYSLGELFWSNDAKSLFIISSYMSNNIRQFQSYRLDIATQYVKEISGSYDREMDRFKFFEDGKEISYFENRYGSSSNFAFQLNSSDGRISIIQDITKKSFTVYLNQSEQTRIEVDKVNVHSTQILKIVGWLKVGHSFLYKIDESFYVYDIQHKESKFFGINKNRDLRYFHWRVKAKK
jgi:hypothetical protein